MGDPRGFLKIHKKKEAERPVEERVRDWREITLHASSEDVRDQAARCMDCGIPFCHQGCPLGNLIPEWNDAMTHGRHDEARARLEATNNFPEITGRVCPAPCEASCVLQLEGVAVTIKTVERTIADQAIAAGLTPQLPRTRSGKRVAVVGSGPAGLAAAQELARAGHDVTVFERDDRVGGLLRYGIPDFKLEKQVLDVRLAQMRAEGVTFVTSTAPRASDLRAFDATVLAIGSTRPRDLGVPGRALSGVHYAMDFLTQQNRRIAGDSAELSDAGAAGKITAQGKRVVVIGGGDTGSDCIGTSIRQGATSVMQLEIMPRPADSRAAHNPWPEWPLVLRVSSSQEEGAERDFAVMTTELAAADERPGAVSELRAVRVAFEGGELTPVAGSEIVLPCDLVLLAMGFVGPEQNGLVSELGVALDARGNIVSNALGETNVPGVFAAGDASRGQSLVVWAIADGRRVARGVHRHVARGAAKLGIALRAE